MPLDVVRLRDSELATTSSGEGFRCAVLLWCAAWHQLPAASLPDDDRLLSQYAGFGRSIKEWRKHRAEALYGWTLCADGRFYHPTVAEKALEAWAQRLQQRWRTECARIKKAAQRSDALAVYPTFEQWEEHFNATGSEQWRPGVVPSAVPGDNGDVSPVTEGVCPDSVPRETASKGREGKGRDLLSTEGLTRDPPAAAGSDERPADHWGQLEGHENPARPLLDPVVACAIELRRAGIQVTRLDKNLGPFVAEGGTAGAIVELSTMPEYRDKPPAYLTAAALRQLREAKQNPNGSTHAQHQPARRLSAADRVAENVRSAVQRRAGDADAIDAEFSDVPG
ncbi:DUF1376 domain-containing protein [Lysobacter enzymogenes]|uniref:DUF1376 domain-containing protein n=1 Tax=Lysobacter enzymogenes TaxID=69 RepID=UPI00089C32E4|nr:DUF1376 domain-containing protein [Lysobacter enzymogenes]SDW94201.1 Protein of unknown function [Lysobacter enzymogenes]